MRDECGMCFGRWRQWSEWRRRLVKDYLKGKDDGGGAWSIFKCPLENMAWHKSLATPEVEELTTKV